MAVVLWCTEGAYLQIGGKSTTFATNGKFFSVKKYRVMNISPVHVCFSVAPDPAKAVLRRKPDLLATAQVQCCCDALGLRLRYNGTSFAVQRGSHCGTKQAPSGFSATGEKPFACSRKAFRQ
ncbi:MAG: hypothetical protein K5928_09170 [Prevotella sp.]|nr:hypothetical protein [Prevotella sp.]